MLQAGKQPKEFRFGSSSQTLIEQGSKADSLSAETKSRSPSEILDLQLAELLKLAKVIEELVKQRKFSWKEVYDFFEEILTNLKTNLDQTGSKESIRHRFYQSLGRVAKKIAKITDQLLQKASEALHNLTKSGTFRHALALIIVGALLFSPTERVFSSSLYDREYTNIPSQSITNLADVGIYYNTGENGQPEAEKQFDWKAAVDILANRHPNLFQNTLLQIIIEINNQFLEEQNQQPSIVGLKIVQDGKEIVSVFGKDNFSELMFVYEPRDNILEPRLAKNPNDSEAIAHHGGIMVLNSPFVVFGEGKTNIYLSGAMALDSHCCSDESASFRLFGQLYKLHPGDEVIVTTSDNKSYRLKIQAVVIIDPASSMDIFNWNYDSVVSFFEQVAQQQQLSPEELKELIHAFLNGELLFLRTCDPDALYTYMDEQGNTNIASGKRVVAIARYTGEQELPPFSKPPFVFNPIVASSGEIIEKPDFDNRLTVIKLMLERLHSKYPNIIEEKLRQALEEAKRFEPSPTPIASPTTAPTSATYPTPRSEIVSTPTPTPTSAQFEGVQVDAQNPVISGSNQEKPAELIEMVKNVNEQLNRTGLSEVLPPITFVSGTDIINVQELINQIAYSNKDKFSFSGLLGYFLLSSDSDLRLLKEYVEVLSRLTEAFEGEFKQILTDFLHNLKLVCLIAENRQSIIIEAILLLIAALLFLAKLRKG